MGLSIASPDYYKRCDQRWDHQKYDNPEGYSQLHSVISIFYFKHEVNSSIDDYCSF